MIISLNTALTIFAFGLTDLPMLGWLAVAAAPLLIQLLTRRKHRETDWAAMAILRAAVQRRSRRLRFEHWLLTAVRTLLIVLVVAAVAGPFLNSTGTSDPLGRGVHRVLVLDDSMSMDYKKTDKTRFDRAKSLARQIIDDSRQSDVFSLVLMCRPRTMIDSSFDRAAILRELDKLEPTDDIASLPATVAEISKLTAEDRHKSPPFDRQQVTFISDLQRTTWAPALSTIERTALLKRTDALAQSASLVVLDVGDRQADNLAVVDLKPDDPPVLTGIPSLIRVKLNNYGVKEISNQQVDLLVDGLRIGREQIDVPPNGSADALFSYTFDAPGDYNLEAVAPGDSLAADNHRTLSLPVQDAIRVLCIDGRPSAERLQGAADYLATALAAAKSPSSRIRLQVETAGENALLERNLSDYDCVFLCDIARFTSAEARSLGAYLDNGGGVTVFLGGHVDAKNYNHELGSAEPSGAGGGNILPARLGEIVDRPIYRIDPLGFRHPILKPFRGHDAGLTATPILKHFKLTLPNDTASTTVLASENGDPLIVEQRVGQGRVVLVATAADPSWSALPLWPSFVPLVHEIAAFCTVEVETSKTSDPRESDLARIDPNELRKQTWPNVPFRYETAASAIGAATVGIARSETGLSAVLLYCALGLLIADTLLSWRFGRS